MLMAPESPAPREGGNPDSKGTPPWWHRHAGTLGLLVALLLAVIHLGLQANLPQIYWFATDQAQAAGGKLSALLSAPINLDDDPMITMRSALFVLREGAPVFNSGDVAQASTSYLLPYLAAALLALLPANLALLALAGLGLLATLLTLLIILLAAPQRLWGALIAGLLLLTSTAVQFSAMGWDHVYQAPMVLLGCWLVLGGGGGLAGAIAAPLLLALGCALRPDAGLIAVSALAAAWLAPGSSASRIETARPGGLLASARGRALLSSGLFLALTGAVLALNQHQFGHLTPTTSRLKLGAVTDIGAILSYLLNESVLSYSALSAALILAGVIVLQRARLDRRALLIALGCGLTLLYTVITSDVFGGFRMAWTPACVLALIASQRCGPELRVSGHAPSSLVLVGILLFAGLSFPPRLMDRIKAQRQFTPGSETAQQYVLARWIGQQLSPADGAIGWYQLGTAFELPQFAAADFLGKADEAIATLPPHRGQSVGHNKWDIGLTLNKWHPQAIVHSWAGDLSEPGPRRERTIGHARRQLALNAYTAQTLHHPEVRDHYLACLPRPLAGQLAWGLLLRRDLAARHADQLVCQPIPPL
jgi:hypothetical protein